MTIKRLMANISGIFSEICYISTKHSILIQGNPSYLKLNNTGKQAGAAHYMSQVI